MLKRLITIILFSVFITNTFSQIIQPTQQEKLIAERFEYIRLIKKAIGNQYWINFSNNDFPGTIVYFTDSASYFINPLPEMKDKVSKYSILENDYDWNIWKLRMPLDSAKFVMETQFEFNSKAKSLINYKTPVLFCSSPELTKKEKTEIISTQQWAMALMHELYHQYQYSNGAIMVYMQRLYEEKKIIDMDSLQGIYLSNKAYHDTLQKENELLKKAVSAASLDEEKDIFSEFLKLRSKRNLAYFKESKFWVTTPENFWEKLEGTCLMMENQLKTIFHTIEPTKQILSNDPMYMVGFTFDENSTSERTFYTELSEKMPYVGTTGYNMVRLLEKNKVPYKDNFFNYASLPLDLQLKYFYKIK